MALTIDIHAHILVPEITNLVEGQFDPAMDPFLRYGGESASLNLRLMRELFPLLTEPSARLRVMDRQRVQYQAVAIAPTQYHYWADPDLGQEVAKIGNEAIASLVEDHPDRFVGIGTLPMQSPDRATAELERITSSYGFRGVAINPSAEGTDYDDPAYEQFWAKAEQLGVLVVLHPNGFNQGERLTMYYMINVVGNPLETTVALSHLVLGGVLQRHPRLKLLAVHGGGYLPFYMDRMDHAYEYRTDVGSLLPRAPSSYMKQIFFDSVVFGDGLDYLINRVGVDHILMGTDYPYDMGEQDPLARISRVANANEADIEKMAGLNAAQVLGL